MRSCLPNLRWKLREEGEIILTNSDMLHQGILPNHFRYVVLDKVHTYRGVFGSHVANVLRCLERICVHYQVRPQFIYCSATIANPRELFEALPGRNMKLIDSDGSPMGKSGLFF